MPVLPRSRPQLSQHSAPRDLPSLGLSSDALLKPLDVLSTTRETPSTAEKRDLPPLSLSSDALLAPLELLQPQDATAPVKRTTTTTTESPLLRLDSEDVLTKLPIKSLQLNPLQSSSNEKRALPHLSLASDSLLSAVPIEGLPLLGLEGDPSAAAAPAKRDASPLLKLDSGVVLDSIEKLNPFAAPMTPGSESKRDLPKLSLSSDSLLDVVPMEGLPLLGGAEEASPSKRDASPLLKVDPQEALEAIPLIDDLKLNPLSSSSSASSATEKRQDDSSKAPPFVQVNTLQFLDKLGRLDLLHPLDPPPPASKRDEASDDESKRPPFVQVNTLQFLDKLGKTNLLDPLHAKRALLPRQNSVAIPTQYAGIDAGPAPGAVAGIVLGSVGGFLLIVWLLWLISNGGGVLRSSTYTEDDVVVSRRRSRSPGTRRSHRSQREMTSRSPRRERVIRQERIVRDRSMPAPETSRLRDTVNIDEPTRGDRRVDGDDIVEVIEEHSSVGVPPPRRSQKNKRSSGYR